MTTHLIYALTVEQPHTTGSLANKRSERKDCCNRSSGKRSSIAGDAYLYEDMFYEEKIGRNGKYSSTLFEITASQCIKIYSMETHSRSSPTMRRSRICMKAIHLSAPKRTSSEARGPPGGKREGRPAPASGSAVQSGTSEGGR
jgi:hypothetical protein